MLSGVAGMGQDRTMLSGVAGMGLDGTGRHGAGRDGTGRDGTGLDGGGWGHANELAPVHVFSIFVSTLLSRSYSSNASTTASHLFSNVGIVAQHALALVPSTEAERHPQLPNTQEAHPAAKMPKGLIWQAWLVWPRKATKLATKRTESGTTQSTSIHSIMCCHSVGGVQCGWHPVRRHGW